MTIKHVEIYSCVWNTAVQISGWTVELIIILCIDMFLVHTDNADAKILLRWSWTSFFYLTVWKWFGNINLNLMQKKSSMAHPLTSILINIIICENKLKKWSIEKSVLVFCNKQYQLPSSRHNACSFIVR